MADPESRLQAAIADFAYDPLGFVEFVFPWGEGALEGCAGPDDWQARVLEDLAAGLMAAGPDGPGGAVRLAVASGHGVGKTALAAWLVLWFLSTRAEPQAVVTANTANQLATKTWRELAKWHRLALNAHWFTWSASRFALTARPHTWFAVALPWSKEAPEAFAGTHERHVLMLYDEASGIHDAIWETSEGAMTTPGAVWCVFGNPTRPAGRFYDCFHKQRHRWRTHRVDARDAARANSAQLAQWIEDYGADSDFVRVRVRGEFPLAEAGGFIPMALLAEARRRASVPDLSAPVVLGVDVARFGEDASVILARRGNELLGIERFREIDTMTLAAQVIDAAGRYLPAAIFVDGVGVGGGVIDRLRQAGLRVREVNAGAQARQPARHVNLRTEMWAAIRDWLRAGGRLDAAIEGVAELAAELAQPGYGFDALNRLQLERKDALKARGLASPDLADALALTFAEPVTAPEARAARLGNYVTGERDESAVELWRVMGNALR